MNKIRVAVAQINPILGDLKTNQKKIMYFIQDATRIKCDVVIFPERALSGAFAQDMNFNKQFVADNIACIDQIAASTDNIIAVVGTLDKDDKGNLFDIASVISNGRLIGKHQKTYFSKNTVVDQERYYSNGRSALVFAVGKAKFGLTIGEEFMREADGPEALEARLSGANIIINLSSIPFYAGSRKSREKIIQEKARVNGAYVIYANLTGGQDELVFDGGSLIADYKGSIVTRANQFNEELLIHEIDVDALIKFRAKIIKRLKLQSQQPRLDIKQFSVNLKPAKERPSMPKIKLKSLSAIDEIYEALVLGTRDYLKKSGFKSAVVGLNADVGSSVVAAIAVEALGKENVTGFSMPSVHSSLQSQQDAAKLASNLGIKLYSIPINNIYQAYIDSLRESFKAAKPDVTEENLKDRIRGAALMAVSNKFSHLALSAADKSEASLGHCTIYGDNAGGFAMLKYIYKTTVYKLAELINEKAKKKLIPQPVIDAAPGAERRQGQKDQDAVPGYDVLDAILKAYIDEGKQEPEIVSLGFDAGLVRKVVDLVIKSEYKRRQSPSGVNIIPCAHGMVKRMSLVNRYRG